MTELHSKRLVQHDILEILKYYSDEAHKLSQHRIQELLESEYGISVDRKTVRRHLSALREADEQHICYNEDIERTKEGKKQNILTQWYYRADLTEGELRFLIDCVLFSDAMPENYRRDLIEKLEAMGNKHFRSIISKIDLDVYNRIENSEFFLTIETIETAIAEGRKVAFRYRDMGIDKAYHLRTEDDGTPKDYVVSPYQFIRANGHSYLVCNLEDHEGLRHFRVDRIVECIKLKDGLRPLRKLPGWEAGMRLCEYLTEHPNLWCSKTTHVKLRCPQNLMNDIVDSFGKDVRITPEDNNMMQVRLRIDEEAICHWALKFADGVEIISPKRLRERVAKMLREALKRYEN